MSRRSAMRRAQLRAARRAIAQEIAHQLRALGREHALGMELHAFDVQFAGGARP